MINRLKILLITLWPVWSHGQLVMEVTEKGEVVISIKEPDHHLLTHPSKYKPPIQDTARFSKYTFHYISNNYNSHNFKVFPAANWGERYTILDSTDRKVRYSVTRILYGWHNQPDIRRNYLIDAKYDKNGRIKSTFMYADFVEEKDENTMNQKISRKPAKYKFDAHGLKKVSSGISYVRNKNGNLLYFIQGYSDLPNTEIYDSLNCELTNGKSNLLGYYIQNFMGIKYRDSLITEYIQLSYMSHVNKVNICYDHLTRVKQIVDFSEDNKHAGTIITIQYVDNTSKVLRLTKTEFATNWDDIINGKQIWEYHYEMDKLTSIVTHKWDSYRWENSYYENNDNSVTEEFMF